MIMQALAVSEHLPKECGKLRNIGRFNHALNFLTPSGELLTLHRNGRGLSPMGWVVAEADFQRIFDGEEEFLEYQGHSIIGHNWKLQAPAVRQSLALSSNSLSSKAVVALWDILRQTKAKSGLHGMLSEVTSGKLPHELVTLKACYQRWCQGESINWQSVIGKGPGLTPSFDDILTGMLLVNFLDSHIDTQQLPLFSNRHHLLNL